MSFSGIKTRQIVYQEPNGSFPPLGSLLAMSDERGHAEWTRDVSWSSLTLLGTAGAGELTWSDVSGLLANGVPITGGGGSGGTGPTGPTGPAGVPGPRGWRMIRVSGQDSSDGSVAVALTWPSPTPGGGPIDGNWTCCVVGSGMTGSVPGSELRETGTWCFRAASTGNWYLFRTTDVSGSAVVPLMMADILAIPTVAVSDGRPTVIGFAGLSYDLDVSSGLGQLLGYRIPVGSAWIGRKFRHIHFPGTVRNDAFANQNITAQVFSNFPPDPSNFIGFSSSVPIEISSSWQYVTLTMGLNVTIGANYTVLFSAGKTSWKSHTGSPTDPAIAIQNVAPSPTLNDIVGRPLCWFY